MCDSGARRDACGVLGGSGSSRRRSTLVVDIGERARAVHHPGEFPNTDDQEGLVRRGVPSRRHLASMAVDSGLEHAGDGFDAGKAPGGRWSDVHDFSLP